jgi:hypothetical protein
MMAYMNKGELLDSNQQIRDWIVGPNYDDGEREFRVFWNACKKLEIPMDRPGSYYDAKGGNMQVSLWDGAYVLEVRSSAHEDSLDGEGLNFVIMAEAAKMKEKVWHKFIRPALADKRGSSLWNTTPEGKNWFYTMWKLGQAGGDPDWEKAVWILRSLRWQRRCQVNASSKRSLRRSLTSLVVCSRTLTTRRT